MQVSQIYVNLPVRDVAATRQFWTRLGFTINEQFSDEKAICVIIDEGHIYAMFLENSYFKTFTNRPLAENDRTQVLLCLALESREAVDVMVRTAVENGGSTYSDAQDHGWMYQHSFADLNGHQWEVMYGDASQMEQPAD